ncbi:MAG: hypothetical protein ACFE9S_11310, partial [Candidatus Hermodarchaeota archaeon]
YVLIQISILEKRINIEFPELNNYFKSQVTIKGIFSVFGDFSVGKTTFALQTALNYAYQGKFTLYIYTKPNFPSEKILLINKYSPEILENIIFIQTTNFEELSSIILNFEFFIINHKPKLKMFIVDSITNLYQLELDKNKKEKNYNLNYQLNLMLANLTYLNQNYGLEILIINEISRKILDDVTIEVESGGNVMKYWVNFKLKIGKTSKLNERKFFFNDIQENHTLEFISNLKEKGFE